MADQKANNSNDIDLHQTAAAFMNSLFSSDPIKELASTEEPKLELDLDKMTSKYDDMSDDQLMGGASKAPEPSSTTFSAPEPSVDTSSSAAPEPSQETFHSSTPSSPVVESAPEPAPEPANDDSAMLANRLDKILSFGYEANLAPEPGSETLQENTPAPSAYETELEPQHEAVVSEASAELTDNNNNNNDNANDFVIVNDDGAQCAPEPGQSDLAPTETVQISVEYAPNVDQTDTPDFYQAANESAAAAAAAAAVPEPGSASFESAPEPEIVHSSVPEPSELTFTAPEASSFAAAPEPEIVSSPVVETAPEPSQDSFVASAPEPTQNGKSKLTADEEEEDEDSFAENFTPKTKGGRRAPWSIPDQPKSNTLDKFGTIRQNIRRGNTNSLLAMWEQKRNGN